MTKEWLAASPDADAAPDASAGAFYNEMLGADGQPRAHWRALHDHLGATSDAQMRERLESVQRQVRENGVTYNVYADARGNDRPWNLDVLPLVLSHQEWQGIERAIIQRATLLDAVLQDVYGPQQLLKSGLMPAALVHGHAGYLRPARRRAPGAQGGESAGTDHTRSRLLHLYAADLARSPDGQWWVVADRTQAPSGAGYALENRLMVSRAFPDLFRDMKVQHLARFFATLRDSLARAAPVPSGAPLIVLLTPGPYNETYFEHSYLARYLGFPLVEGSDLTVRNGCVWLKTLTGLERVHGILRRLDDDYCDPLELRDDSTLGVAGLSEVVRRGNVLLANGLGSSLLESGALLGYLPALCESLLGESLRMPSVATWWCGDAKALQSVTAALDRLVIKPAFPQLRQEPVFGRGLGARERDALLARLQEQPNNYVAQEVVQLSHAPVWDRSQAAAGAATPGPLARLQSRPVSMRVFACASPDGYVVMPGGLCRAGTGPDARVVSMQRGGSAKDIWVLSPAPVSTFSLLRRDLTPADLVRSGANLSSRVVENLYWFGRYAERCDGTARLLRLAMGRTIDAVRSAEHPNWRAIAQLLRNCHVLPEDEPAPGADDLGLLRVLRAATVDASRPGLAADLQQLLRVAGQLRERLSVDNWRSLSALVQEFERRAAQPMSLANALSAIDRAIVAFMSLSGFALDGMTRDLGWRFLSIGRRIERLQFLCAALREAAAIHAIDPNAELDWLLELADSTITYRSRYMARPQWLAVLDLLALDESNPRSLAFQVKGIADYLERLAKALGPCGGDAFAGLRQRFADFEPVRDLAQGSDGLMQLVQAVEQASITLADELGLQFFSHSINRQTFAN